MNKPPIIFLDVDGVANTRVGSLDADKLDLLAEIVRATGAEVVVSSNWRKWPDKWPLLVAALESRGITIAGRTPVLEVLEHGLWRTESRGWEIGSWLEEHPGHSSICILDDMDIPNLRPFLIRTRFEEGLQPSDAADAIRLLRRQNGQG